MGDADSNSGQGRISALVAWLILAGAGFVGAAGAQKLQPAILLALARMHGGAGLPAGLEFYLGSSWMLWFLPAGALSFGLLSTRFKLFRSAWLVGTIGGVGVVGYAGALFLMATYLVYPNINYAGNAYPNRLPEVATRILSDGPRVFLFDFGDGSGASEFHGRSVSTRLELPDDVGQHLAGMIQEDVIASDGRAAMCFDPAYGVSFDSRSGQLDLLLCYDCGKLEYWLGGRKDRLGMTTNSCALVQRLFKESVPAARLAK